MAAGVPWPTKTHLVPPLSSQIDKLAPLPPRLLLLVSPLRLQAVPRASEFLRNDCGCAI